AGLQHLKTEYEKHRLDHAEITDALNEVQKRFYSIGADIAKIEQLLQHHHERRQQLNADKIEAEQQLATTQTQLAHDQETLTDLQERLEDTLPEYDEVNEQAAMRQEMQEQAELALEAWRDEVAELQQISQGPSKQADTEKMKIAQYERQIQQTQERQTRLDAQLQPLSCEQDMQDITILDEKIDVGQQQLEEMLETLEEQVQEKERHQTNLSALRQQVKTLSQTLNGAEGQLSALQTLQAASLGKNEESRKAWLVEQGIHEPKYLAQMLNVKAGWEIAVETVLEGFLEAVGIEQTNWIALDNMQTLDGNGITLVEWQENHSRRNLPDSDKRLVHFVENSEHLPACLYSALYQVHVCHAVDNAKNQLASLQENETLITAQGWWFGRGWIKVRSQQEANQAGVLQRAEKIKTLMQDVEVMQQQMETLQIEIDTTEEAIKTFEDSRDSLQQQKNTLQQELTTYQSDKRIKQSRIEQNQKRYNQIQHELTECQEFVQLSQQDINSARSNLQEALEKMSEFTDRQENLAKQKDSLQEAVHHTKAVAKEATERGHQLAMKVQTYKTQIEALTLNIERFEQQ
ncbi:MAG TPA: hypothetical protein PLD88_05420, partial [Candidatus Berkiella sp.]|nr:hypothetical protein [Candidatus Berkiella sp.]